MWKKIAIAGGATAALLAAGSVGLLTPGSSSASPELAAQPAAATTPAPATPSASTSPAVPHHGWHGDWNDDGDGWDHGMGGGMLHGSWVTQDPQTKATTTYDVISGDVTAVSAGSVTVKAADGVSQTYGVTADTKVRSRSDNGTTASGIDQVKAGDSVRVFGTGTGPFTATYVLETPAGG